MMKNELQILTRIPIKSQYNKQQIKHTVFPRSDAVATNFLISLEPAATIPGRRLLEDGINKLQLGNMYKINTRHDCHTMATWT